MGFPSTDVGDQKAGIQNDFPAAPPISAMIEDHSEEYVVYEELLEKFENNSLDCEEGTKDSQALGLNEHESTFASPSASPARTQQQGQEQGTAKRQTLLKIEYV